MRDRLERRAPVPAIQVPHQGEHRSALTQVQANLRFSYVSSQLLEALVAPMKLHVAEGKNSAGRRFGETLLETRRAFINGEEAVTVPGGSSGPLRVRYDRPYLWAPFGAD